jgi:preprotein translocase subunit SecE
MTEVAEKKGLVNFLKETRLETKKVSWPTRTEVTSSTLVILIIMVFFGFLIGGMDSILAQTVKYLLQMF